MATYHILYNPYAGNGWSKEKEDTIRKMLNADDLYFHDMTKISYRDFFESGVNKSDNLVIIGGDGTLNRFVNDTENFHIENPIFYLAGGSGNDFMHDIGGQSGTLVQINRYLEHLPTVTVNGSSHKFINGIGFGIDGYCCEVGDAEKQKRSHPVNYTAIAVNGLLFHFHPVNAVITVDGVQHTYESVWFAPTMNGRYYGGGMMPAPDQDRADDNATLSVLIWHGKSKLKTLTAFPSIFKGEHLQHKEMCEVLTGHDIQVVFEHPSALQIDGETISGVLSYEAISPQLAHV